MKLMPDPVLATMLIHALVSTMSPTVSFSHIITIFAVVPTIGVVVVLRITCYGIKRRWKNLVDYSLRCLAAIAALYVTMSISRSVCHKLVL